MSCNSYQYPESQNSYTFPKYDQTQKNQSQQLPVQYPNNVQTRAPAQSAVTSSMPVLPSNGEAPSTVQNPYYTAGFLKNFLGKNMRVEFLIGSTGALVDRVGKLVEVGASYIVLQPYLSDDLLMADLYSIKFVTIYG